MHKKHPYRHETFLGEMMESFSEKKETRVENTPEPEPAQRKPAVKKIRKARRDVVKKEAAPILPEEKKEPKTEEKSVSPEKETPLKEGESAFSRSLDGAYDVWEDPEKNKKRPVRGWDIVRYAVLFAAIFGFFFSGYLVVKKLYGYYQARELYQDLRAMVKAEDPMADEYLPRLTRLPASLKISDLMSGKTVEVSNGLSSLSRAQQNIVTKLSQLRAVNPDLAGWITISGTVVDYPVMWSAKRSYYLRRDFYGNYLNAGTIYIDNRNSRVIPENRNTVIYGHNMQNGSMFASLHDFSSATVFYNTTIEILTEDGVYVYTPFSVHESLATDNYFETNFVSDSDFLDFCQEMQLISLHPYEYTFTADSKLLTLSTCVDSQTANDLRWAVHAVLTKVIR